MTISITFYDTIKYHQADFMNRDKDFFGNGCVNATDFPVTFPATPNMTLNIGIGTAWVDGFRIANDAVLLLIIAAASAAARTDIIQIGHDDVNRRGVISIKQGVSGGGVPVADAGYLKLYEVAVGIGQVTVGVGNVTSRRTLVPINVLPSQLISSGGVPYAVTGGTSTVLTATFPSAFQSLTDGMLIKVQLVIGTGSNPTLNVDGLGAKAISLMGGTSAAVPASNLGSQTLLLVYDSQVGAGSGAWVVLNNMSERLNLYALQIASMPPSNVPATLASNLTALAKQIGSIIGFGDVYATPSISLETANTNIALKANSSNTLTSIAGLADGSSVGDHLIATVAFSGPLYDLMFQSTSGYQPALGTNDANVPATAMRMQVGSGAVKLLKKGYVKNSAWTWVVGGLIYLSAATGGLMTQTQPSVAGNRVQIIGYAESATVIYFNPDYTWITI